RLLAGEEFLSDYQFGTKSAHHLFCTNCGVRPFGRGYIEQIGGDYVSVQVAALDNVAPEELLASPVRYADGRNNAWWNTPAETRHL
ncbi:MAG TPA: GFA family protein, partial [Polyangiaceae bacterium]